MLNKSFKKTIKKLFERYIEKTIPVLNPDN